MSVLKAHGHCPLGRFEHLHPEKGHWNVLHIYHSHDINLTQEPTNEEMCLQIVWIDWMNHSCQGNWLLLIELKLFLTSGMCGTGGLRPALWSLYQPRGRDQQLYQLEWRGQQKSNIISAAMDQQLYQHGWRDQQKSNIISAGMERSTEIQSVRSKRWLLLLSDIFVAVAI